MDDVRNIAWRTYGQTDLNAVALLITGVMALMLWRCRRGRALIPFLVVAHLIPDSTRLVVAGVDFTMLRLLIVVGLGRALLRGELGRLPQPNTMDWCFGAWVLCGALFETLRDMSMATLVYRIGFSLDAIGIYLLTRLWLRSAGEWVQLMRVCVPLLVLIAIGMAIESQTAWNVFFVTGADPQTWIKDGAIRPSGPIGNPILVGSYAASLVPVYGMLTRAVPAQAALFGLGAATCMAIVLLAHASGPVVALVACFVFLAVWPWRALLPQLRIVGLLVAVVLHFAREKPIWHLIGRLSDLLGGTGYHRYRLIDAAVNNIGEWWLVGSRGTQLWGWGLEDITNQYILEGVVGGIWTLFAFLALIGAAIWHLEAALRRAGRAQRAARGEQRTRRLREQYLLWGLGAGLVAHCASFISVSYFGQVQLLFFASLASLSALAQPAAVRRAARPAPAPVPAPQPGRAGPRGLGPPLVAGSQGALR